MILNTVIVIYMIFIRHVSLCIHHEINCFTERPASETFVKWFYQRGADIDFDITL